MELPNQFKFIHIDDNSVVFKAKSDMDYIYVTWDTDDELENIMQPVIYSIKEGENCISKGFWNIVE